MGPRTHPPTPGLIMPAFSKAISSRESPRMSWWSRPIEVIAVQATLSTILVASSLPPRPHSNTTKSICYSRNSRRAIIVTISKKVTLRSFYSMTSKMRVACSTTLSSVIYSELT